MSIKSKISNSAAAVLLAALASGPALAEITGNIGVTSNYISSGVTQTSDGPAVSGGLDFESDSGFYLGAWASNIAPLLGKNGTEASGSYELDLYLGISREAGSVSYDVGAITYLYPIDAYKSNGDKDPVEADFTEIYGSIGFDVFSAGLAYTLSKEADVEKENDLYVHAGVDIEIASGASLGVLFGNFNFADDSSDDYSHFAISLSKDDFTLALEKNDLDGGDEPRVAVSWSKSFDL